MSVQESKPDHSLLKLALTLLVGVIWLIIPFQSEEAA